MFHKQRWSDLAPFLLTIVLLLDRALLEVNVGRAGFECALVGRRTDRLLVVGTHDEVRVI